MSTNSNTEPYYPLPESQGGWRVATDARQARALTGIDTAALAPARAWNAAFGVPSSVVIIRRGYLVAEWHEQGSDPATQFNIYSCSKSFTGTAYGIVFEDARQGKPGIPPVGLETPAYAFVPEGKPLSDPRKERITLRHLLSMSSGIAGESAGIAGLPTAAGVNPMAAAVGHAPFRPRNAPGDVWVARLAAEPGEQWDYSDPAFVHLALAFAHIAGRELSSFVQERVAGPLGIERLEWDLVGIEDGSYGRHTLANGGIHLSARELARFGYLMARGGVWKGQQLVAPWWIELATRTSQQSNTGYGLTWWVNTAGAWKGVPRDAFSAMGLDTNLCCVIPSLDLVIVRLGTGPRESTEVIAEPFLAAVCSAVADV